MKQFFSYLGASLAAIAALASCNKEIDAPVEDLKGGVPFEICASTADTKTAIDGLATRWEAGDDINLFHAVANTTDYTSDGQFIITAENLASKKFTGTLPSPLEAGNYDWYAFYPYSSYNRTPAGSAQSNFGFTTIGGKAQTQDGNNSTAHLSGKPCPLYGVVKSVASNVAPKVEMNHLTSIIEVNVTNNSGKALTVSNVSFTGTEDIVGTYYVNFAGTPVGYTEKSTTEVSNTVSLSVANGTPIADGASAQFYVAVKPFTAPSGQTLKVSVNGYSKDIPLTKDVTFSAGKIKKVNFNCDKVAAPSKTVSYTVKSTSEVTVSGTAPVSSSVAYSSTYTTKAQLIAGKSMKLTLSGYKGVIIKGLTLSMKSNKSAGAGYLSVKAGDTVLGSIGSSNSGVDFKNSSWYGAWSTTYVDVTPLLTNTLYTVQNGEDIVIIIGATTNSLYCQDFTIEYVEDPSFIGGSNPEKLAAPKVSCSARTANSLTFTWAEVANASGYQVSTDGGTSYGATQTETTYTWSGLQANTEYTLYVKAVSDNASYTASDAATATDKTTVSTGEGGEGGTTKYFVKVTSAPSDWSGEYLIVYETDAVAFDGSLTTLDAAHNTVSVTITDSKIIATDDLLTSTFTINADGTTIKSKSGYYIGQTTNGNGLKSSTSTSYTHKFSFDKGDFTAISAGAYLRFNSDSGTSNYRFRYYKSSSYTGQKAIQLYKLEN